MAHAKSIERKRPLPIVIPPIECADGYELSVQASSGHYCTPREDWPEGGWSAVEVGYPSERPEPWGDWEQYAECADDPTATVYGWVPLELVRELIEAHGGVKRTHAIERVLKGIGA